MVNAVSPQRQTIQIYVSGCVTQYNKTGLQPVSRLVEQVHNLDDRQIDRQDWRNLFCRLKSFCEHFGSILCNLGNSLRLREHFVGISFWIWIKEGKAQSLRGGD